MRAINIRVFVEVVLKTVVCFNLGDNVAILAGVPFARWGTLLQEIRDMA